MASLTVTLAEMRPSRWADRHQDQRQVGQSRAGPDKGKGASMNDTAAKPSSANNGSSQSFRSVYCVIRAEHGRRKARDHPRSNAGAAGHIGETLGKQFWQALPSPALKGGSSIAITTNPASETITRHIIFPWADAAPGLPACLVPTRLSCTTVRAKGDTDQGSFTIPGTMKAQRQPR